MEEHLGCKTFYVIDGVGVAVVELQLWHVEFIGEKFLHNFVTER